MKPLTLNVGSNITIDGLKHVVFRKTYHTRRKMFKYYLRRSDGVEVAKFEEEILTKTKV